jgi:hypothetical protein
MDPERTLKDLRQSVAINRLMIATQFQMMFGKALGEDRKSLNPIAETWNKWREAEGIYDPLNSTPVPNPPDFATGTPPPAIPTWALVAMLIIASLATAAALISAL